MMHDTGRRASVLVVDDAIANLQLLGTILEEAGYEARGVPSGERALQAAERDPPDLFLLDVSMPEMDGYELCERLKRHPRLCDVPVIFITARTEVSDKVRAFSAGCVDYVTKPFQTDEVRARVDAQVRIRNLQLQAETRNRELEESYQKLNRLEALRDTLVHMIVHDLRSPLGGIMGFLEELRLSAAEPVSQETARTLDLAYAATEGMMEMINSVLDVSKLEDGRIKLRFSQCDLVEVVNEAASRLQPLAQGRAIRWESEPTKLRIAIDRGLISRVLQNLLGNALKFSPKGEEVRIGVGTWAGGARVQVRDRGPGIPAEYHQKIFEKYGQAELRGRNPALVSTGLGLAFCKLAVEAHGGQIGVESEVGQGSTFWFILPRSDHGD